MTTKQIQTVANEMVDDMAAWRREEVATLGYKGALPEGLSEDERFELLNAIQDTAKCVVAGAVRG